MKALTIWPGIANASAIANTAMNSIATKKTLPEKVLQGPALKNWAGQGLNDFGNPGYNGPCPPQGKAHRYFFKLYALDLEQTPQANWKKADLVKAMEGHILAEGSLMGTYQRQ